MVFCVHSQGTITKKNLNLKTGLSSRHNDQSSTAVTELKGSKSQIYLLSGPQRKLADPCANTLSAPAPLPPRLHPPGDARINAQSNHRQENELVVGEASPRVCLL